MGAYMAKPSTEKHSDHGSTEWLSYGMSSMQGWRMHQEDAHNCIPELDKERGVSLFAVYDGHGGPEVARYCAAYIPEFLLGLASYGKEDLKSVLKQLFLEFDSSLTTAETRAILNTLTDPDKDDDDDEDGVLNRLNQFQGDDDDDDDEESDSELRALRDEAKQPLEFVLEQYGGENALPSNIKKILELRRRDKVGECSTSSVSSSTTVPSDLAQPSDSSGSVSQESSVPRNDNSTEGSSASTNETELLSKPDEILSAQEIKTLDEPDDTDNHTIAATSTTSTDPSTTSDVSACGDQIIAKDEDEDDDDSDDESVELDEEEEDDEDDSDEDETDEEEEDDDDDSDEKNTLKIRLPAVLKGSDDTDPGVDSGSTACVALLLPINGVARLYVANAGDSRAVLCRGGAAVDLSVDHKPEDEDEKARIVAAGGTVTRDGRVNSGLNLSRALGDHSYKQTPNLPLADQMITPVPDVTEIDLIPGSDEFLVIACDGVWNSMTSQEVVDFIYVRLHPDSETADDDDDDDDKVEEDNGTTDSSRQDGTQLSKICEEIFDRCLAPNTEGDGTGCDNMTCIIVRFDNLPALIKRYESTPVPISITSDLTESRKRHANSTITNGNGTTVSPKKCLYNNDLSEPSHNLQKRTKTEADCPSAVPNGDSTD